MPKPKISYDASSQCRTLTEFVKEEVVDRTKEISKMTWELVRKWTKK